MRRTVSVGEHFTCRLPYLSDNNVTMMADVLELVGQCATSRLGPGTLGYGDFEARLKRQPRPATEIDIEIVVCILKSEQIGCTFYCRDGDDEIATGQFTLRAADQQWN